mmetsp:Transcript_3870/g.7837  ORF Transcript_3870/g.7837 Transcript_3870/m.7837 type:complete len:248 (-) Transcript_3870:22-765(-)
MATTFSASRIINKATATASTSASIRTSTADRSYKRKRRFHNLVLVLAFATATSAFRCTSTTPTTLALSNKYNRPPTPASTTTVSDSFSSQRTLIFHGTRAFATNSNKLKPTPTLQVSSILSTRSTSSKLFSSHTDDDPNTNSSDNIDNNNSNGNTTTTAMLPVRNAAARQKKSLRGLFAGAGADGISNPLMVEQILKLLPPEVQQRPNRSDVNVLYVGTATYDLEVRREQQTRCFVDQVLLEPHLLV